jgi:ceramide glucosyltransferase
VLLDFVLGGLAGLSLALLLWQWRVAYRFPLHAQPPVPPLPCPPVTLLKPLKGADDATETCLRSWFTQDYAGPVQILFGVGAADDPACPVVRKLQAELPGGDAQLLVCDATRGTNAKVSKLVELANRANHDILVISDADVRVPPHLLAELVARLNDPKVGLVNCFYCLANPATAAMQWEAVAINADFWSQVLQACSLKPVDFALGAVMAIRNQQLVQIGGFMALKDCLADDFHLGRRIARAGYRIELASAVVDCWDPPKGWGAVWRHQLRWARTIRVSQPVPYFFSILSNPTLWPLLWLVIQPGGWALAGTAVCLAVRIWASADLQRRLTRAGAHRGWWWMAPIKDLLQVAIWALAFMGNRVEWRGVSLRLRPDGTLVKE